MSSNQIMEQDKLEVVNKHQVPISIQDKLHGRVAQILNARELIINIGQEQGVKPKMHFAVLSKEPLEVRDPETGELLDKVEREKVRVEAIKVRDRLAICKTYRTFPQVNSLISAVFRPSIEMEKLEFEDSSLPPPLSEEESYVKIGDQVVYVDDE